MAISPWYLELSPIQSSLSRTEDLTTAPSQSGAISELSKLLMQGIQQGDQHGFVLEIKQEPNPKWHRRTINDLSKGWCPPLAGGSGRQRDYIHLRIVSRSRIA
jgi:hypothetical protein